MKLTEKTFRLSYYFANKLGDRWERAVAIIGASGFDFCSKSYYHRRLFCESVYKWQVKNGLNPDGVLGPKSVDFALTTFDGEESSNVCSLRKPIFKGSEIDFYDGPLVAFDGMYDFGVHPANYRFRNTHPKTIVLHWDVALSARACYQALITRGLSIHFTVDADGTIRQHLDLDLVAYHATFANNYSVGIEINNPYWPRMNGRINPKRRVISELLPNGGKYEEHLDFAAEQKEVIVPFVSSLAEALAIQKRLPGGSDEKDRDEYGVARSACIGNGDKPFNGLCGHYHLQSNKIDPGRTLWPLFLAEDFRVE